MRDVAAEEVECDHGDAAVARVQALVVALDAVVGAVGDDDLDLGALRSTKKENQEECITLMFQMLCLDKCPWISRRNSGKS